MKRKLVLVCALAFTVPSFAQVGGRPTRPKVQRPEGAAWDVIRKNCVGCHGIDDYAFYAQDRAAWQKLITAKHPPGQAALAEQDQGVVLDWLVSKFGPDAKPFPRTYIPPEITTFFTDPEAKRIMNRACTRCHGMERIETTRHDEEAWRVVLVDMRERGAVLADEELERLVEWLGRVWGTNRDK
jgi:cytochrome c5